MADLTPDQISTGTKQIMTHAERQKFLANSVLGKLLGYPQEEIESSGEARNS